MDEFRLRFVDDNELERIKERTRPELTVATEPADDLINQRDYQEILTRDENEISYNRDNGIMNNIRSNNPNEAQMSQFPELEVLNRSSPGDFIIC